MWTAFDAVRYGYYLRVARHTWKAWVSRVEVGFHGRSVTGTFGLIIAVAMKCTGSWRFSFSASWHISNASHDPME